MAASIAGAFKAAIEAGGLGLSAFRDEAPASPPARYCIIHEEISVVPEPSFPAADDPTGHVSELVQVDLVQQWRDPATQAITESFALGDSLQRILHGSRLAVSPKRVFLATVIGRTKPRLERDENKVRRVFTVKIRRTLT